MDLIQFADEENSVVVRVRGRLEPGILHLHDYLDAEIVVATGFAGGRLDAPLSRRDLDDWERALDTLGAGQSVSWMDDARNPEIQVERTDEPSYVEVVVFDPAVSGTSVRVPVRLPEEWLAEHRERLRRVRQTWPSEVVETSYGALAWRAGTPP